MAIIGTSQLAQVLSDNTSVHTQFIHKTGQPAAAAGVASDLSMAAGIPKFNAYVGDQGAFTPLIGSANAGIYTGEAESGKTKYLTHWWLSTQGANTPCTVWMCDYVGFYPLIDMDSTDLQELENVQTIPRYTDGNGLRIMIVQTITAANIADFVITYTNEKGVAGRTITCALGATTVSGNISHAPEATFLSNKRCIFLPLQDDDQGVRSIQSIQFLGNAGGFGAIVLVKPLCQTTLLEQNTICELDLLRETGRAIDIEDDAYLNMIMCRGDSGSLASAVLRGGITVARI
jgi:hypothetical protein